MGAHSRKKGEKAPEPVVVTDPRNAIRFVKSRDKGENTAGPRPTQGPVQAGGKQGKIPFVAAVHMGVEYMGRKCKEGLEVWAPTTKGHMRKTGDTRTVRESEMRNVIDWGGRPLGMAESVFPHPKQWRFDGLDMDLDRVTVRAYTRALVDRTRVAPSCLAAWRERIGELPHDVGEM